ncbi:DcaP family trimeric outer membrane transporter [Acinetobacter sp. GSS19]|uniref:DcaP family trimeric outer membrane transporter n=1 Tax=Acinetobacter sp. GSS19 TaxID=3020716 RepID=UPI00235E5381|nr:DcaP family trimeric outer membrane transporter [Acinetobacter sp. GSS19]
MRLPLSQKRLMQQSLTITVVTLLMNTAHATSEQDELQQLKMEVKELRTLIERYQVQTLQTHNTSAQVVLPSVVRPAPLQATSSAAKEGLQLTTAAGSEFNLYGFLRADVQYQAKGGSSIFNRIDDVALDDAHQDKMYSSVATSRLGLDFKKQLGQDKVGGKIEVDFRGSNDTLRIRHAYLTYNNWLFGQTTSTFVATDLMPEMLDFNTNLGGATYRNKMVRYQNKITPQTEYFVALEEANDGLSSTKTSIPALTAKLKYNFADNKGTSSLRGLVTERKTEDDSTLAWGVGLGAAYQLSNDLRIMADYYHVEGDGKFVLYSNDSYLIHPATQKIEKNVFDSVAVGATYQLNSKLRSTLGYGVMLSEDNAFAQIALQNRDSNQNQRLQQAWFNVMYSPVNPLTFGVEYVYGERETFTGEKGQDNRVGAMAKYTF